MPTKDLPFKKEVKIKGKFIAFTPVSSANISSFGYNASREEMYIFFHSNPNHIYIYKPVDIKLVHRFMEAESQGKFFNEFIKPLNKGCLTVITISRKQ